MPRHRATRDAIRRARGREARDARARDVGHAAAAK
jgi:hypothetical protein